MTTTILGRELRWPLARGSAAPLAAASILWLAAMVAWGIWTNVAAGFALVAGTAVWLLTILFFRDPEREIAVRPGQVIGPGDGRVVEIAYEHEARFLQQDVVRVSIFLTIFDVHVQRAPLAGRVRHIERVPGSFVLALSPAASQHNEQLAMVLETDYGPILVKQIAGIAARRCLNYSAAGEELAAGQRFGMIRFGSRVDLCLPPAAKLLVGVGDRVRAGLTPVAQMPDGRPTDNGPN